MAATRPTIFVCKHGAKYVRFASYSTIHLVDFPEQATPYRRKQDAVGKTNVLYREYVLNNKFVKASVLTAVAVTFPSHSESPVK